MGSARLTPGSAITISIGFEPHYQDVDSAVHRFSLYRVLVVEGQVHSGKHGNTVLELSELNHIEGVAAHLERASFHPGPQQWVKQVVGTLLKLLEM